MTFKGPVHSWPFTSAFWSSRMNSASSTDAPMEACQGKPFRDEATTSLAAAVSRETTPLATSWFPSMRMPSVWPTPCMGS